MIHHADVIQNSAEWHRLRAAIPTASEFDSIITPANGDLSKSSTKYMCRLLAAYMLGRSIEEDQAKTPYMERGNDMEPMAAKAYTVIHGRELQEAGFITNDAGTIGCSLDRMVVGERGAVEIKCPSAAVHVGYLINPASLQSEYRVQLQGQIWLAELDWDEVFSFHPELPPVTVRAVKDDAIPERKKKDGDEPLISFHDKMIHSVTAFSDLLEALKVDLSKKYGPFPEFNPDTIPEVDMDAMGITDEDVETLVRSRGFDGH